MKNKRLRPLVRICLSGDLTTDYRVHKTAMSLIEMGFDVECVLRIRKGFGIAKDKPYRAVYLRTFAETGPFFYLLFNLRLAGYLLFKKTDVVLSIDLDTLPGCALATKFRKTPLVFDSHEYFPEVPELQHRPLVKRMWTWLEKLFVPKIDKGYTVCGSIASMYENLYRIHFDVVRNLPSIQKAVDAKPIIHDSRFVMVYQGAVNLGRGLLETVDALRLLDDVLLVIVGDGDVVAQVKARVEQQGVEDKVLFIGKVPFSQLAGYTLSANVGLCLLENLGLNYYYSLPNRIFDFALAGIPVLASNFPEIREVVGTYGTGMLVDNLEPETIANAIHLMRAETQRYAEMSENAKEMGKRLVWENELPVLRGIYGEYLEK